MALPLTPQVFSILSHLIEERTGLHYRLQDSDLLAEKISDRAYERGLDSLLDYYYFLRYDAGGPAELEQLVDALVVNETYFFREMDQLRGLTAELVPALLARSRPVRIWCAASSTGEEPYTIAMMLDELGLLRDVRIVATDVSNRALTRARAGIYAGRAFRTTPEAMQRRFFEPDAAGAFRVCDRVREAVRFARVNLRDEHAVAALGEQDVILARNVFIYFEDDAITSIVGALARSLREGGYLLVGASESLLRFATTLACEERGGAFFYRRGPR
jgi:chemotaxis protein methyltransferase CheR